MLIVAVPTNDLSAPGPILKHTCTETQNITVYICLKHRVMNVRQKCFSFYFLMFSVVFLLVSFMLVYSISVRMYWHPSEYLNGIRRQKK